VVGTNTACNRFIAKEYTKLESAPFLIRGTKKGFERPRVFRTKNGAPIEVGRHNADCRFADLDGDGVSDLLIGAENGKVYCIDGRELQLDGEKTGQ